MDAWGKSLREDRSRSSARKNPSFSSTLLDAIYRSIDDGERAAEDLLMYKETARKKQSRGAQKEFEERERSFDFRRGYRTEKKVTQKITFTDYEDSYFERKRNPLAFHSNSSSSDSSSGVFSSSEPESVYGEKARTGVRPKPIRTGATQARPDPPKSHMFNKACLDNYDKPKSKAKKQPSSPGARLASFLNSILAAAGTAKKVRLSSSFNGEDLKAEPKSKSPTASSSCSTASSYSRSCLSKTPSSRGKPLDGVKRSVRFYPVSVIVDEDSRPCGQKRVCEEDRHLTALKVTAINSAPRSLSDELKFHLMEKNKRVEEVASKILSGYNKTSDYFMRDVRQHKNSPVAVDEDEDDDAASDSSSDLFELESLAAIGIGRYREELPVYETTHLDTNRAIAKGLIL